MALSKAPAPPRSGAAQASRFTRFAKATARASGRPVTFGLAIFIVLAWGITGPIFQWSDTWQLVINTGTTIITFLMVFLIQNTQNRDSEAVQVKLDELIRSLEGAHNALINLEEMDDDALERVRTNYARLAAKAREDVKMGKVDTGAPELDDREG